MKKVKFLVWAFLAWQIATIFYKDESFREKFKNAEWLDKAKVLFDSVLDLNKKIFFDIKDYDYETKIQDIKEYFEHERQKLEEKFEYIKWQADKINQEKLKPMIKQLESDANYLKDKLVENAEYIDDKYEITDKVDKTIKKIKEYQR